MYRSIRTSIASLAALIAVACAPTPVLAATKADDCTFLATVSASAAEWVRQGNDPQAIAEWIAAQPEALHSLLEEYALPGIILGMQGADPQEVGKAAFAYCMKQERV